MRLLMLATFLLLLLPCVIVGEDADSLLDKNSAFFEGENQTYVIQPPRHFIMVVDKPAEDGYSFAFIPKDEDYDSASVVIGVNIFRIKDEHLDEFSLEMLVEADTSAYREHYGPTLLIEEIDPIKAETGEMIPTYYVNDTTRFIPNVMISYFDGKTEIVIFEISISDAVPRFKAEELYIECLRQLKVLEKGSLGVG